MSRIYLLILFIFSSWLLYIKGFNYEMLYNHDHLIHLYRSWYYRYHLLPNFEIWGWDKLLDAGYPVGFTYPFFTDLLISGTHLVLFDLLSLEQVYVTFVVLSYFFFIFACYRLGKYFGSPLLGFLTGILCVLDHADHPTGGWTMYMFWGVWVSQLSMAFYIHAIVEFLKASDHKNISSIWLSALLFGLSLLTHSMQIFGISIFIGVIFLSYLFTKSRQEILTVIFKLAVILFVSVLISAPHLLTYIYYLPYTKYSAQDITGFPTYIEMIIYDGYPLKPDFRLLTYLALLTAPICLISNQKHFRILGIMYLSFFALMSGQLLWTILPEFLDEKIKMIEYKRFFTFQRPFSHVLTALAITYLCTRLYLIFPFQKFKTQALRIASIAVCFLPLIFVFAPNYFFQHHKELITKDQYKFSSDIEKVSNLINQKVKTDKFFRVYIFFQKTDFALAKSAMLFRFELKAPVTIRENYTALHFHQNIENFDHKVLRDYNFRYVVSDMALNFMKGLKYVEKFGDLYLYEFKFWNPNLIELNDDQPAKVIEHSEENFIYQIDKENIKDGKINMNSFPNLRLLFESPNGQIEKHNFLYDPDKLKIPVYKGKYTLDLEVFVFQKLSLGLLIFGLILSVFLRYRTKKFTT